MAVTVLNVKNAPYSATGNGVANDAPAVQAAINAANTAGGGIVFFPTGNYRLSSQITLKDDVHLRGVSITASVLQFTELGLDVDGIKGQDAPQGGEHAPSLKNLQVKGPSGGAFVLGVFPANMNGIRVWKRWSLTDVWVRNFCNGIIITGDHQHFQRVKSSGNYQNVAIGDMTGDSKGNQQFYDCDFTGATFASIGMHPDGQLDSVGFYGAHLGFAPYAIHKDAGTTDAPGITGMLTNSVLLQCGFESCGNAAIKDESSGGGSDSLYGTYILRPGFSYSTDYKIAAVDKDYVIEVRNITGCTFDAGSTYPFAGGAVADIICSGGSDNILRQTAVPVFADAGTAGRFRWERSVRHAHKRRTSADITVNSTSWINLDTGLDLAVPAAVGDVIEVAVNTAWGPEVVTGYLDVATLVSGSPVTYFSTATGTPATSGLTGWIGIASQAGVIGSPASLTLVSGDISAGTVTVRLRTSTSAATNKNLVARSDAPLQFSVKNLGTPG